MKTSMVAVGRFMYGNWYGAVVVFAFVTAVLCGLQFANSCMGDLVPWPKDSHNALMFLAVVNIGIAMVVSLVRRRWGLAFRQLVLVAVAFVCYVCIGFISYCTPTRMAAPPSRKWTESTVCLSTGIANDDLTFLGGISQRESVLIFAVADIPINKSRFLPGSPWTDEVGVEAIGHYRHIMEFCRLDVALPDDAELSHCDSEYGNLTLIATGGKHYLVYERL